MASTSVTIMVDPRGVVPTPDHVDYATWMALPKELRGAYLQRSLAIARADSEKAEKDVAFWERTYRITKGVATMGFSEAWDYASRKMREYRENRRAVVSSIATMDAIASDPKYAGRIPAELLAGLQQDKAGLAGTDSQVSLALGPLTQIDIVRQEAGLSAGEAVAAEAVIAAAAKAPGPAKLGLAGIALLLTAAAAAIGAAIVALAVIKDRANARTHEFLMFREKIDAEAVQTGQITQEQYENRRAQNAKQASKYNESQDVNLGAGLLKPILVAGGVALVGYLAYRFIKRRSAAPAA